MENYGDLARTENFSDLADGELTQLMQNLTRIMKIADDLAKDGSARGHEVYVLARDSRDSMMFDVVSRETMRRLTDNTDFFQGYAISKKMLNAMKNNQKIEAIKCFREETGLGLREAKDWVEAYMDAYDL